jgi:hypothetical protein
MESMVPLTPTNTPVLPPESVPEFVICPMCAVLLSSMLIADEPVEFEIIPELLIVSIDVPAVPR